MAKRIKENIFSATDEFHWKQFAEPSIFHRKHSDLRANSMKTINVRVFLRENFEMIDILFKSIVKYFLLDACIERKKVNVK